MKINKNIIRLIFLNVMLPMVIGIMIYLFLRPSNIIFIRHIAWIRNIQYFYNMKNFLSKLNLPVWFIYSLPDGIWVYSLTYLIGMLWINQKSYWKFFWLSISPIIAITYELSQKINIIVGTFDSMDLFFIILASVLANLVLRINLRRVLCEK